MPACARKEIVLDGDVAVYHCWSRCVRRAFLCGEDPASGKDYSYRRNYLHRRQQLLAQLFALEIGFHAELSSHIHLIVRTRPDIVETWSDEEVVRRWLTISKLTRHFEDERVDPDEAKVQRQVGDAERVAELRRRLASVSWFMASLCENVARRSNAEDGCSGRFWEGRFCCRHLADETAILVCGIYVDLNQIRAGEAATPEESRHTSAYDRIQGKHQRQQRVAEPNAMPPDGWLCELTLQEGPNANAPPGASSESPWRASDKGLLPLSLEEYLQLLDWTGRQLVSGKRGVIPSDLCPILERLHIQQESWCEAVNHFEQWFRRVVGRADQVAALARRAGRCWFQGIRRCAATFA